MRLHKTLVVATLAWLAVVDLASGTDAVKPAEVTIGSARRAMTSFAGRFYEATIESRQQNIAISPFAAFESLAMVEVGARGKTSEALRQLVGDGREMAGPLDQFRRFGLVPRDGSGDEPDASGEPRHPIRFARGIWLARKFAGKTSYGEELGRMFGVRQFTLDTPASLTAEASEFVRQETGGRIEKLEFADLPDRLAVLWLNVLAMNADWEASFDPRKTRPGEFKGANGPVQVDYMQQVGEFPVADLEHTLVLDLAYANCDLLMRIYLPKTPDQLADTEKLLSARGPLDERVVRAQRQSPVTLKLPKFRIEQAQDLSSVAEMLGISQAFGSEADFRGIDPENELTLVAVHQQVVIEIDESGTRAGARTEVQAVPKGGVLRAIPFHAMHPFVFEIRSTAGAIFFMGRVSQPAALKAEQPADN